MTTRKAGRKTTKSTAGKSPGSTRAATDNSLENYKTWLECLNEGVWVIDRSGHITFCNPRLAKILGYMVEEITGKHVFAFMDNRNKIIALEYEKRQMQGIRERHDFEFIRKDGKRIIVSVESAPRFDENGTFLGSVSAIQDITGQREMEENLRASEERYRLLIENAAQGIVVVQDLRIKYANNKLAEITGYDLEELLGKQFMEYIHPDDLSIVLDRHRRLISGADVPPKYSFRIINKRGEPRWLKINAILQEWEGRPATLNFLSDITEQVDTEKALRDANQQYQSIIEFLPDATFVINASGEVIAWNRAIEEMTKVEKKDILGKGEHAYAVPFYGQKRKLLIDYILENTPDLKLNYMNVKRDGNILYADVFVPNLRNGQGACCMVKASLLFDSGGNVAGAIESVRDITELKLAEKAMMESEKRYRNIFNHSRDGIFQSTPGGKFIRVNQALAQIYGLKSPEEVLARITDVPSQLYANPEKRKELTYILQSDGFIDDFEAEFMTAQGKRIWVLISARSVRDDSGNIKFYEGTVRDISKRKTAEEELRRIQAMQKATLESTADGIIVTGLDGTILLSNHRFAEIWHFPEEIMRKNHSRALVRYAWNDMEDPEDFLQRAREIKTSEALESSVICFKDGRILERFSTPLIFNGEITGRVASYRDISDIQNMEEELYRTQKLDSLGILAGGIAHDFNNILTGILGNITLARMETRADTSLYSILDEAEKAAIRAKDLTMQLLTFARGGAPVKKTAALPDILLDTVKFALRGSKSTCEFDISRDLWHADIDKGQISQVINNIIINSDEAMPQGGSITIKADNIVLKANEILTLLPGHYLKIRISDSGIGISEEHLDRIFDPYFTTKQRGSGLGLATSYSIVKSHGGTITVDSQLGSGSIFNIYLPAANGEEQIQLSAPSLKKSREGRILVMDDEPMVLEVATRMLRHIGYSDIETAADGSEAINKYSASLKEGKPYSIVITDLTVPGGIGGEEAIRQLLELNPDVKVIVSSGYSSGPVLADYKQYGFSAVAGKPYTVEELTNALDEALGA